jgi:RNA polymerase-binding transcription factor DksA
MFVTKRVSSAGLSPADKAAVHRVLTTEHEGTVDQIAALTRDWEGLVQSSVGVSIDDEHDPEGATLAFERSQLDGLLLRARGHLDDLDRALERLDEGSYGVCEECKRPIAPERLTARPAATTCIRCAARRR